MIKADCIDASEARKVLRNLGLEPMAGSNNDTAEFWVTSSGHPVLVPYFKKGDKTRFLKHAFEAAIDDLP